MMTSPFSKPRVSLCYRPGARVWEALGKAAAEEEGEWKGGRKGDTFWLSLSLYFLSFLFAAVSSALSSLLNSTALSRFITLGESERRGFDGLPLFSLLLLLLHTGTAMRTL
jgi:hypothetical protein